MNFRERARQSQSSSYGGMVTVIDEPDSTRHGLSFEGGDAAGGVSEPETLPIPRGDKIPETEHRASTPWGNYGMDPENRIGGHAHGTAGEPEDEKHVCPVKGCRFSGAKTVHGLGRHVKARHGMKEVGSAFVKR